LCNEFDNQELSEESVCDRWKKRYSLPVIVQHFLNKQTVSEVEKETALAVIQGWRERLVDISWVMRGINEFIARKANKEERCTGLFWEGRFKS